MPELERINGVADASLTGDVNQSVEVKLSDSKIEDINNKLLASVNSELYDAKKSIDEGKSQLRRLKAPLKINKKRLPIKKNKRLISLAKPCRVLPWPFLLQHRKLPR